MLLFKIFWSIPIDWWSLSSCKGLWLKILLSVWYWNSIVSLLYSMCHCISPTSAWSVQIKHFTPLHPLHAGEQLNLCLLQEQRFVLQSFLQAHWIIFNSSSGAGSKSVFIGSCQLPLLQLHAGSAPIPYKINTSLCSIISPLNNFLVWLLRISPVDRDFKRRIARKIIFESTDSFSSATWYPKRLEQSEEYRSLHYVRSKCNFFRNLYRRTTPKVQRSKLPDGPHFIRCPLSMQICEIDKLWYLLGTITQNMEHREFPDKIHQISWSSDA